jgi:hypothetical protein
LFNRGTAFSFELKITGLCNSSQAGKGTVLRELRKTVPPISWKKDRPKILQKSYLFCLFENKREK